jgi:hypothetical protein
LLPGFREETVGDASTLQSIAARYAYLRRRDPYARGRYGKTMEETIDACKELNSIYEERICLGEVYRTGR